jgi:hypothetical protein
MLNSPRQAPSYIKASETVTLSSYLGISIQLTMCWVLELSECGAESSDLTHILKQKRVQRVLSSFS